MMFFCLLRLLLFVCTRLYLKSTFLYPLFLSAVSYSIFDAWKISAFEKFLHNLSLIVFGSFFIICGGWFEFCYEPFIKLNVISKKLTIFKFVSMSILKPISLKIFVIFLRSWSTCWPFMYSCIIKPSSL